MSISATDRPVLGLGVGGEVAGEAANLTVQQLKPVCCWASTQSGLSLIWVITNMENHQYDPNAEESQKNDMPQ